MAADTFTYIMKNLDRAKWQRIKAKAALEGLSVRALLERQADEYLGSEQMDYFTAMEWGYKAAEKGWNIQRSQQEFRKVLND